MKKHFALVLIGTALASSPVLAQQSNAPAQQQSSSRAANQDRAMVLKQGEWRGSKLTGLTVYNNNDERVGDINELILGRDGKVDSNVATATITRAGPNSFVVHLPAVRK